MLLNYCACLFPCRLTTPPPAPALCAVEGCRNPKKYSDSATKLPLCSLQCYRTLRRSNEALSTPNNAGAGVA